MQTKEIHDRFVTFLEDVTRLEELLRESNDEPDPVLYQPVIMTREDRITIGKGSRIDGFVKLEGGERLVIGRYVHIASHAHIGIGGGYCELEDFTAVASGGKVLSGSNSDEAVSMSACAPREMQKVVPHRTIMKKYSVVCTNAVVLPGVTLHEGAELAAGGVATRDIPEWEVWGGIPARFIRKRVVR